jgi:hypothetical protein
MSNIIKPNTYDLFNICKIYALLQEYPRGLPATEIAALFNEIFTRKSHYILSKTDAIIYVKFLESIHLVKSNEKVYGNSYSWYKVKVWKAIE